ncbi:sulfate/thiosulfate transporter subunit [Oceanibaculum pacificum]|uniref:Sulfate transport system permease protein CysT n=1 Tax=Oceanibaculum pacificum TaxID=580166 RepID=A0A154W1T3_9PROT|nr:sulfate/thiosulfate transporter subunit [Oceanibaculum pacificum]
MSSLPSGRAAAPAPSRRRRQRRALPGFGLTLGLSATYLGVIVLLPIAALLLHAASLSPAEFWAIVSSRRAVATYRITLSSAFYATLFNAGFGLLLAWVLVRYDFTGRRLLDAMIDLPFALPTAVAGIALTALFARNGIFGQWLEPMGIKIAYAQPGIVIAMAFTSLPFVVRTIQPVLEDLEVEIEEAGHMLGATDGQLFARVIWPVLMPSFLAGASLAFARSLGEFGAVVFIAGNLPMRTEITALLTYIRIDEYDYPAAAALATVILLSAFVMLFAVNALQLWQLRYMRRS